MGEKKELRAEVDALKDKIELLERELDDAHGQLGSRAMGGGTLDDYGTRTSPLGSRTSEPWVLALGKPNGAPPVEGGDSVMWQALVRIAAELDVGVDGMVPTEVAGAILDTIRRIKNPDEHLGDSESRALSKGDSLAGAIEHNRTQRAELDTALTRSRAIVNRVAASLQVGQWDADGTEIVEKAQRWAVFAFWLKKRVKELRDEMRLHADPTFQHAVALRIGELDTVLTALVAPKDLARYVTSKPATETLPKSALELAEMEMPKPTNTFLDAHFNTSDLAILRLLVGIGCEQVERTPAADRGRVDTVARILNVLTAVRDSALVTNEFLSMMNLFILPLLRKQHAAGMTVAPVAGN